MARIRTIKPEFFTDDVVTTWPVATRLTFIGLWTYVDDAGRGLDNPRLVKAAVWPLDEKYTDRKVDNDLALLATAERICRYEVQGRKVFHVLNWRHQKINRPSESRLPVCPIHEALTDGSMSPPPTGSPTGHGTRSDDSVSAHGTLTEPSPPSRAPADQGSGNREHGTRTGTRASARQPAAADAPTPPSTNPTAADAIATIEKQLAEAAEQGAAWDLTELVTHQHRDLDNPGQVGLVAWWVAHAHDRTPTTADIAGSSHLHRAYGPLTLDAVAQTLDAHPDGDPWPYAAKVAKRLADELRDAS